jgi:hypothetical protein
MNAPDAYKAILQEFKHDELPSGGRVEKYDFIQVFATTQADLENLLKQVVPMGKYDCLLWACYPKGTGKIKSDIKRETVWAAFVLVGLDTVTAISIDETWSALRGRPKEMVGK